MKDGGLAQLFRKNMPKVHWQRIENTAGSGVPDINGCFHCEVWIEFKEARGKTIILRPEQVAWLMRRSRAGGRCFIAVRRKTKRDDQLLLIDGSDAFNLKEAKGRTGEVASMFLGSGGPSKWDWDLVRLILFKRSLI